MDSLLTKLLSLEPDVKVLTKLLEEKSVELKKAEEEKAKKEAEREAFLAKREEAAKKLDKEIDDFIKTYYNDNDDLFQFCFKSFFN